MRIDKQKIIGIACGAACAVAVLLYTQGVQAQADQVRAETLSKYGGDQVEVCVATRDISAGETMDSASIDSKLWIASLLPAGAVTDPSDVVGQQVTSPIIAGEVISTKRFSSLASSFEIPAGYVAVSVSAKEVQAVGGTLKPGSLVDVYSSGNTATSELAKGVLVLATSSFDGEGKASGAALTWVALAVKPNEVEGIIAAEQKTQLYFALPSPAAESEASHES